MRTAAQKSVGSGPSNLPIHTSVCNLSSITCGLAVADGWFLVADLQDRYGTYMTPGICIVLGSKRIRSFSVLLPFSQELVGSSHMQHQELGLVIVVGN